MDWSAAVKWSSPGLVAIVAVLSVSSIQASLLSLKAGGKSGHCGECASGCQPIVTRPCCQTVYNYQRKQSLLACCGECCDRTCAAPMSCGPCAESTCCAPVSGDAGCCVTDSCGTSCPAEGTCCAPVGVSECGDPSCCAPCGTAGCTEGCSSHCSCGYGCHDAESCRIIAELIHQSKTGCYATVRRRAIHRLGDHFDCCCHPEIMSAFIYALNDSDERVRAKAADEIGDQVRRNRCICGPPVIAALRCSLADCDRIVRREAEQSLRACGYEVVEGACNTSCSDGCGSYCPAGSGYTGSYSMPTPAPSPSDSGPQTVPDPIPAPAPVPVDAAPPTVMDGRLNVESVSWKKTVGNEAGYSQDDIPLIPAPNVEQQSDPRPLVTPEDDWSTQAVPPPAPVDEPEDVPFGSRLRKLFKVTRVSAQRPVERLIGEVN